MAKGDDRKQITQKKDAWYSLSQEDTKLALTLFVGMLVVAGLCMFTPVTRLTTDSINAVLGKNTKGSKGGLGDGVYYLGQVLMTLRSNSEYIDSEIDLEYDGGAVTTISNGEITSASGAKKFLRGQEGKIRDAIVMESAGFTAQQVKRPGGIEHLKSQLVMAMNQSFRDEDLIKNIYFRKLLVYTEEDEG
ncbi:MAG: flagellar basal body-associated FliL family protein [Deltaproteobacteria bacterium]|nr:flagellar basal body-associated FliL family protein [Deltaproteobacteria bacterium]